MSFYLKSFPTVKIVFTFEASNTYAHQRNENNK